MAESTTESKSTANLRELMRQEQYKRGLLKSAKLTAKAKPKEIEHSPLEKVQPRGTTSREEDEQLQGKSIPKGFFDDPKAQEEVEVQLKKEHELKLAEQESKKAEELAKSDLANKESTRKNEDDFEKDLEELEAFTKAVDSDRKRGQPEKVYSSNFHDLSYNDTKSMEDNQNQIQMGEDNAVTATAEETMLDKYADRMIHIVKKSLRQKVEDEDTEDDKGLQEMSKKLSEGIRRKRKLEEREDTLIEAPW